MTILFISDLHLSEAVPHITEKFLELLSTTALEAQALYILGDFFEVWIGDDHVTAYHQKIISALAALAKKIPVYFMHGNRDFLIGPTFAKQAGCQLLQDPHVIDLYGRKTLLMHGDSLCLGDEKYLRFRRIVRNPLVQKIFLASPLRLRQRIAQKLRTNSKKYTSLAAPAIMDVTQHAVENIMEKYQVNLLIHGHTHKPALHEFLVNGKSAQRIVLAAWHEQGNLLYCDASGNIELRYF